MGRSPAPTNMFLCSQLFLGLILIWGCAPGDAGSPVLRAQLPLHLEEHLDAVVGEHVFDEVELARRHAACDHEDVGREARAQRGGQRIGAIGRDFVGNPVLVPAPRLVGEDQVDEPEERFVGRSEALDEPIQSLGLCIVS